jgi:hypothetical protein
MRPKARWLAQHGGPSGWLEERDPAGCDFVRDGRSMPNVHKTPSWATSRMEGMAWYSSRPMPSLWVWLLSPSPQLKKQNRHRVPCRLLKSFFSQDRLLNFYSYSWGIIDNNMAEHFSLGYDQWPSFQELITANRRAFISCLSNGRATSLDSQR